VNLLSNLGLFNIVTYFIIGLTVFQVRGLKKTVIALDIGSIAEFLKTLFIASAWLMDSPLMVVARFLLMLSYFYLINYVLCKSSYFIGANISRYRRFRRLSKKLFYHVFIFLCIACILHIPLDYC